MADGMEDRRESGCGRYDSLEAALVSLFGADVGVAYKSSVAGGDINEAYRLTLTNGTCVFMKANAKEREGFFGAEAAGLAAIAQTGAIRTPKVLGMGADGGGRGFSFLLLEHIDGKKRASDYWEVFAQQLAAMHRAPTDGFVGSGNYGFRNGNYIGATKQLNMAYDSWVEFFRDCRLKPQFEAAQNYFDAADRRRIEKLMGHIGDFLVEPSHPSLLHGDLWSGNVIAGNDGRAWLIDPAVYVGHAEADIAMTELFGGFPPVFYDAYREAASLPTDYGQRRDLYNLYQLLNHLNLFGGSYRSAVMRIVERYT